MHAVLSIALGLYAFVTWPLARRYRDAADVAFLAIALGMYVHWMLFNNECIISYWEKRELDPTYEMGRCPVLHPYRIMMQSVLNLTLIEHATPISILLVLCRINAQMWAKLAYAGAALVLYCIGKTDGSVAKSLTDPYCIALHERAMAKWPAL